MPSPFHRMLGAADRTVDRVNAEAFSFQPMREVKNARPVADDGRDAIAGVMAIFDDPSVMLERDSRGSSRMVERSSSGPLISILETLAPQGVRRPDRFVRDATGKGYEVRAVNPDGMGRLFLDVVEIA